MTSAYVDRFGGQVVQPTQVGYNPVDLTASIVLVWPEYAPTPNSSVAAGIMPVTAATPGLSLTLPDATLAGPGRQILFYAPAQAVSLLYPSGSTLATLGSGQYWFVYTTDAVGGGGDPSPDAWAAMAFGVGSSLTNASAYAGYGLKALGATLNQAYVTSTISANTTVTAANRASVLVNVGGSITATLPLTSAVSNDFFLEFRNQGTGTLTLSPTGGELVDASATVVLQVNESCVLHAATGAWYTVGRGRNASFNFTQLTKAVTGGTTNLTTTEAANVVQKYTGVLLSNQTVVLPAVVQVYYISNQTTGAFAFTLQSPTPGSTLVLPSGQNAVVFCDGTNVINCSTSLTGISALLLLLGSAASPSLAFGALNNGLYGPSNTTVAVAPNGVEAVRWAGTQTQHAVGSAGLPAYSFLVDSTSGMFMPAANQLGFATAGAQRGMVDSAGRWGFNSASVATAQVYTAASFTNAAASEYGNYTLATAANTSGAVSKIGVTGVSRAIAGYAGTGAVVGVLGAAELTAAVTAPLLYAVQGAVNTAAAGTVTTAAGFISSVTNSGGAAVTNLIGYLASDMTAGTATLIAGYYGNVTTGTGKWNLYVPGSARSYHAGRFLIGTATENTSGAKLQVSDGITFPATQVASSDANTLDDYEEGTWTPTLVGETSAGTGTYLERLGTYTKVGNVATCWIDLSWTAHTGTGPMQITGLPFAVKSSPALVWSVPLPGSGLTYLSLAVFGELYAGGSVMELTVQHNEAGPLVGAPMASPGNVSVSFSYPTA